MAEAVASGIRITIKIVVGVFLVCRRRPAAEMQDGSRALLHIVAAPEL